MRIVIVGAGAAGLATAACLRRRGLEPVVLDRNHAVGSSWRRHYRRLHLHTYRNVSHLPGRRFRPAVGVYPSRREVIDYLDDYAEHFGIQPRFGQEVQHIEQSAGGWRIRSTDLLIEADSLVIATGYNRVPHLPTWPGRDASPITALHSSQYQSGEAFGGQRVLVVGAGNSGAEIALDLCEHGVTTDIAIRGPLHIVPRDLFGMIPTPLSSMALAKLPTRIADRVALMTIERSIGDLRPFGITRPRFGPLEQVLRENRIPLIDVGTVAKIRSGAIGVRPGLKRFAGAEIEFNDGDHARYDTMVLATGYRPALESFFPAAAELVDRHGKPRFHAQEVPAFRGLYFIGFRNPPTGALNDIRREAREIAAKIAQPVRA